MSALAVPCQLRRLMSAMHAGVPHMPDPVRSRTRVTVAEQARKRHHGESRKSSDHQGNK